MAAPGMLLVMVFQIPWSIWWFTTVTSLWQVALAPTTLRNGMAKHGRKSVPGWAERYIHLQVTAMTSSSPATFFWRAGRTHKLPRLSALLPVGMDHRGSEWVPA